MKTRQFLSVISIIAFTFFIWASGDKNDSNSIEPGKITKDQLCKVSFTDLRTIKSIGMELKTKTVFNCDGTFRSGQDWSAQENAKEAYENTGISTSGQFEKDMTGSYEIIEGSWPSDAESALKKWYGNEYEKNKEKITLIKYQSSNGISGYCFINYGYNNNIYLSVIFMNQISEDNYENSGSLGMWEGKLE